MDGHGDETQPAERLATEFIDSRGPQFHDAFGVPCYFNRSTSAYEAQEIADLRETIERHRSKDPSLAGSNYDVQDCTWDDVHAELEKTQFAAQNSEARSKKFFPRIWHGLGKRSEVVVPALDAIPDIARVLRAGLVVIFSLARHRNQVRQKILDAFENIPNIVQMAEKRSIAFIREGKDEENRQLNMHVTKLKRVIVQVLPNLIDALDGGTFLRRAMSPFCGFNMDELLGAVYHKAEAMRVFSDSIKDGIVADTHSMARDINKMAQGTQEWIEELHRKVDEILLGQRSLQLNFELVSGKNHLFQFLMENQKQYGSICADSRSETLVNESRGSVSPEAPTSTVTLRELLGLLDVPHLALNEDEDHVLRHGRSLDKAALSTASLMIRCQQVQQLLGAHEAGVVLAEGCGDRGQMSRVSPISVVCATLAHALRTRPTGVTLLFFCGRHVAGDDGLCGPQGMMRSLLVQLIFLLVQNGWISDFARISLPCGKEELQWKRLSLSEVCLLFHQMLEAVPSTAEVFCLVDGITFFECDDWCDDYDMAMATFGKIIDNQNLSTVFKLLIMTPTRSIRLSNLQPHQRVALRNSGSQGSLRSVFRNVNW